MLEWLTGIPYPYARRVIVNCKDGVTLRGVLWQRRGGYLVLRQAELLSQGPAPIPVDGEALVFRTDVSFLQILPSAEAKR